KAFEGETVSDTLAAVLRADVEWGRLPAGTPQWVIRLLKRCLERDSKRRLRDIGDAWIEADRAPEMSQVVRVPQWRSWAAAAVLAAAGVGAGWWLRQPVVPVRVVTRSAI